MIEFNSLSKSLNNKKKRMTNPHVNNEAQGEDDTYNVTIFLRNKMLINCM